MTDYRELLPILKNHFEIDYGIASETTKLNYGQSISKVIIIKDIDNIFNVVLLFNIEGELIEKSLEQK